MPNSSFPRRGFMGRQFCLAGRVGPPGTGGAALPSPVWLDADLERLRLRYRLPGAAALVLRAGQTAARGVAGRRSTTATDRIHLQDPFLIGSCGKSMTATVVAARLVQQGRLSFDNTLEDLFPELRLLMRQDYRTVSVGEPTCWRTAAGSWMSRCRRLAAVQAERRALALLLILALPPKERRVRPISIRTWATLWWVPCSTGCRASPSSASQHASCSDRLVLAPLASSARPDRRRHGGTPPSACHCRRTRRSMRPEQPVQPGSSHLSLPRLGEVCPAASWPWACGLSAASTPGTPTPSLCRTGRALYARLACGLDVGGPGPAT